MHWHDWARTTFTCGRRSRSIADHASRGCYISVVWEMEVMAFRVVQGCMQGGVAKRRWGRGELRSTTCRYCLFWTCGTSIRICPSQPMLCFLFMRSSYVLVVPPVLLAHVLALRSPSRSISRPVGWSIHPSIVPLDDLDLLAISDVVLSMREW